MTRSNYANFAKGNDIVSLFKTITNNNDNVFIYFQVAGNDLKYILTTVLRLHYKYSRCNKT